MSQDTTILVIGAGIAGLMAASEFQRSGRRVLLLDKGRGVGGRLATRRIEGATFDHGAQFITARTPRFATALWQARADGAAEEWGQEFGEETDGYPRWRGRPGMSAVAKHLARGLELRLETPVASVRLVEGRWRVECATGAILNASAVVMTPPVPQSLAILDAGGTILTPTMRARLEAVKYERCLAVMAVLESPSHLSPPGGLSLRDGPIAWMADNQLKGISAEPAVTIHATHDFSVAHWDLDREKSGRMLLEAASGYLGSGVKSFQVHGWRYSRPMTVERDPYVLANTSPPLILAGDAFGGARVEGAARSGWAAAAALLAAPA